MVLATVGGSAEQNAKQHNSFLDTNCGSTSVSGQLPTYPSPNPTLTLTCCQLTVVEFGEG